MDFDSRLKRTRIAIVVILSLALLAGLGVYWYINSVLDLVQRAPSEPRKTTETDAFKYADKNVMRDQNIQNILLIGQDRRKGQERQRSDSMIICSVNKKTGKITLVSLMRDMYVSIPGYASNRINTAYLLGGMNLLDETIEQNFGIHIDGNVEVDFSGFMNAMAEVGNLDVYLSQEEADHINNIMEDESLRAGMNSLNPRRVLIYSRMRYVGDGDYERTERQRKVLMTAFSKLMKSDLPTIVRVAKSILPYFTTDLTNKEILGYVYTVLKNDMKINRTTYRLPVDGAFSSQNISGMAVLVPDLEMNKRYLIEYLYGPEAVEEFLNREDAQGLDGQDQDSQAPYGQDANSQIP